MKSLTENVAGMLLGTGMSEEEVKEFFMVAIKKSLAKKDRANHWSTVVIAVGMGMLSSMTTIAWYSDASVADVYSKDTVVDKSHVVVLCADVLDKLGDLMYLEYGGDVEHIMGLVEGYNYDVTVMSVREHVMTTVDELRKVIRERCSV